MRASSAGPLLGVVLAGFLQAGAVAWAQAADGWGPAPPAVAASMPAAPRPLAGRTAAGPPCTPVLDAEAGPGATVRLRLEAPCLAGRPATFRHGAVAATYLVSASGIAEAVFPAFATEAAYAAELADGRTLAARASVPGAAGYEHVATIWSRGAGLSVHAFEFGAPPGSDGHVRAAAPRSPAAAEGGLGGYLLALGTPGLSGGWRAEVYSFPAGSARRIGTVRIGLGIAGGGEACATPIEAEMLQLGEGLPGAPVRVSLPASGCGATAPSGGMLKNLARDLKIAGD